MEDIERLKQVDSKIDRYMEDFSVRNKVQTNQSQSQTQTQSSETPVSDSSVIHLFCHVITDACHTIFMKVYKAIKFCISKIKRQ